MDRYPSLVHTFLLDRLICLHPLSILLIYFVHFHIFFVIPISVYTHFALTLFQDIGRPFGVWKSTFEVCWRINHLCLKLICVPKHEAKNKRRSTHLNQIAPNKVVWPACWRHNLGYGPCNLLRLHGTSTCPSAPQLPF